MMGLNRIGLSRTQRNYRHELRIALVRLQHRDWTAFHDFRLDITGKVAVDDRARLGLERKGRYV
jgi:hypothetical protein